MSFSTAYAAIEVAVVAAVASTFLDIELAGINPAGVAVAAAASFFGTVGFSLALAAVILAVRDRLVIESAAFSLMSLLSGVSFPTSYLPAAIQPLAEVLPLTHALRALRAAAVEQAGPPEIASSLVALVVLGAAYLVLGIVLLERAIRRTVEQTT
jgi:ABC-2 type transport system permease protein